jgi:hypothetical protein
MAAMGFHTSIYTVGFFIHESFTDKWLHFFDT